MKRKPLMEYAADKGSFVINGIAFGNGIGDGEFYVFFDKKLPKGFKLIENVWIDLRECNIKIWTYDCNCGSDFKEFSKKDLKCEAIQIARDQYGNFCLVKYF